MEHATYDPWKDFLLRFYKTQQGDNPFNIVVYEAWRLRASKAKSLTGSDMQSVQCVGGLKLISWVTGVTTLHTQEPAIKPIADKYMAAFGHPDYLPDSDAEHPKDAVRHLWYYAITKHEVKPSPTPLTTQP